MNPKLSLASGVLGLSLGAAMMGRLASGCILPSPVAEAPAPAAKAGIPAPAETKRPASEGRPENEEAPRAKGREPLGDFTMATLDGKPWRLSDQKGKVVLLNFWATWCPPCREETPDLVALAKKYKARGLEVVGVTLDQNAKKVVPAFVKEYEIPYSVLVPKGDEPVLSYARSGIPTTVLIDKNGRVEGATTGMVSPEVMGEQIESLLKAAQ